MRQHPHRTLQRVSPVTNAYHVHAVIDGERQNIGIVRYRSVERWDAETLDGRYLGTAITDWQAADLVKHRSCRETQARRHLAHLRQLVARADGRREQRIMIDLRLARAILKMLDATHINES